MQLAQWLNTDFPLIQAPMAGSQDSQLAIAVSNAGGLGSLPGAMLTPEALHAALLEIQAGTRRPYNVNFFCHQAPTPDAQREAAWRQALQPYYDEFGIDPADIPTSAGQASFSHEFADVLEDFKPPVVSFHFGLPAPDLLARVKKWGAKVLSSATTVEEGIWLEKNGADAVIAQGLEAGGYRGMFLTDDVTTQIGTFALVPQLAKVLTVPVIAAGGIADAAGVKAAMALGAAGVQIGTAYLLAEESTISAIHRAALKSEAARHTALTNLFSGRPARGIVNRFMRKMGPLSPLVPAFPMATAGMAPLRSQAESQESGDFSPLWSGQHVNASLGNSAAEITKSLALAFAG